MNSIYELFLAFLRVLLGIRVNGFVANENGDAICKLATKLSQIGYRQKGARNPAGSLVLKRGVDLCVAASVKLPHFEDNLTTFGVAIGRLIALEQPTDFFINWR